MQQNRMAENMKRGLEFDRFWLKPMGIIPFEVSVATDSAEFTFRADHSALVKVKNIAYLHGSVGYDMEYHTISVEDIRYLALDWPIKVVLTDSTVVRTEAKRWRMMYQNGEIAAAQLSADSIIWIPVEDIARIESGYQSPF